MSDVHQVALATANSVGASVMLPLPAQQPFWSAPSQINYLFFFYALFFFVFGGGLKLSLKAAGIW